MSAGSSTTSAASPTDLAVTAHPPVAQRLSDALRTELQRQDRASWHSAVWGLTTLNATGPKKGAVVDLSYSDVDDCVVVAVMEALVRVAPSMERDHTWSVSLRGNSKVTDASAASCTLLLYAVGGVATLDLFETAIGANGIRTITNAAAKLAVKPDITLPSGETLAASTAASTHTGPTTTTTSTGPIGGGRAGGLAGMGGGPRGAPSTTGSGTTSSSIDIAALRRRRDELFRREGIQSMEQATREAAVLEAQVTSSAASSTSDGPGSSSRQPSTSQGRSPSLATQQPASAAAASHSTLQPVATGPGQQRRDTVSPTPAGAAGRSGDGLEMRSGTLASGSMGSPIDGSPRAHLAQQQRQQQHATRGPASHVMTRQPHPAHRQKMQQQQQQHQQQAMPLRQHTGSVVPLNPNMISSATVAVHHRRQRSESTYGRPNASGDGFMPMHSRSSTGAGAFAGDASTDGQSPHAAGLSTGLEASREEASSAAGRSPDGAPGSDDATSTVPTEMPDRQDDIDILQNLGPHDRTLNLCQSHPRLSHEAILDPRTLQHLTVLNIAQNALTTLAAMPPSLLRLDASGNELQSLAGCLTQCRLLTVLNVRRNELTELDGLEHCLALKHLFVGRNHIRKISGIGHILGLESLDVSFNFLKTEGSIRALSQNCGLLHLIVYGNPLAHKASSPKGLRGVLRNLLPSLVAVDNERLPSSTGRTGGGGGGSLLQRTPPPRQSGYDDRSSFLGVQERVANMSAAQRRTNDVSTLDTSRQHALSRRHADPSIAAANASLQLAASVMPPADAAGTADNELSSMHPSRVAGYSTKERQDANATARAEHVAREKRRVAHEEHLTHPRLSRPELQRRLEARNAALLEVSIATRIAQEHHDHAVNSLELQEELPPAATSRHNSKEHRVTAPQSPANSGGARHDAVSARTPKPQQHPRELIRSGSLSNVPMTHSASASQVASPVDAFLPVSHTLDDALSPAGEAAHDAFLRNVSRATGGAALDDESRHASMVLSGHHRGSIAMSHRAMSLVSPKAADDSKSNSDVQVFAAHASKRASAASAPQAQQQPAAAAHEEDYTPVAAPYSASRSRLFSPDSEKKSAGKQHDGSPLSPPNRQLVDDPEDDPARHVHFSPIARLDRTDVSHAAAAASGGVGEGLRLAPPTVKVADLVDTARDPGYVQDWIARVDTDDSATYLALRTLLVVLENDGAIFNDGTGDVGPESKRCVDAVERNGLVEDLQLPADVADYFDFTDEELNADDVTEDPDEGLNASYSRRSAGGDGGGRRARLLDAIHRISGNKTCLRYMVALVRSRRLPLVRYFIEHLRAAAS